MELLLFVTMSRFITWTMKRVVWCSAPPPHVSKCHWSDTPTARVWGRKSHFGKKPVPNETNIMVSLAISFQLIVFPRLPSHSSIIHIIYSLQSSWALEEAEVGTGVTDFFRLDKIIKENLQLLFDSTSMSRDFTSGFGPHDLGGLKLSTQNHKWCRRRCSGNWRNFQFGSFSQPPIKSRQRETSLQHSREEQGTCIQRLLLSQRIDGINKETSAVSKHERLKTSQTDGTTFNCARHYRLLMTWCHLVYLSILITNN